MWNTSSVREALHNAPEYGFLGIDDKAIKFDWASLKAKRDAYVARLNGIYANNLKNDKVAFIQGHASFVAARTLRANGVDYEAKHVLIATGGHPLMDEKNIEGAAEHAISSDGFFELPHQPR